MLVDYIYHPVKEFFKTMNILLIYPPKNPKTLTPSNLEPLALEILAATVRSHNVKIIDLRFDTISKLDLLLKNYCPDVVGISVNNTIQVNQSKYVLKHIKNLYPQIINVVGGHHPTLTPEDFYKSYVEAIFLGWAEKSFPEYISYLESNKNEEMLPGIILLKNG